MFTLEYLGGEIGSNRDLLLRNGVTRIGFSFHRFHMREKKTTNKYGGVLSSRFPEGVSVHLHPGLPEAYDEDIESFAAMYEAFIVGNAERLDSVTEIDRGTPVWVYQQRKAFYDQLDGPTFRPIWHHRDGYGALQSLAEKYSVVAIPHETVESDTSLAARIRSLVPLYYTSFHALGSAAPNNLRSIPFDSASSLAWLTPQMRGETIIWEGGKLLRYPKVKKEQARKRHRTTFVAAGFDPDLIDEDDYNEVIGAAIWSFKQLEKHVSDRRGERPFSVVEGGKDELADNTVESGTEDSAEPPRRAPDNTDLVLRHLPTPRDPSQMAHLPTLNLEMQEIVEQGETGPVLRQVAIPSLGNVTLRQCDTCFVAAQCPAMRPGSSCAFHLPIEVRTKDQLRGLLQAMIEMQGQRIAFARFSEELQGGYPDPIVSGEMDRLFKLVKQLKEMEENKEFIKITAERHAGGGVLSALFGERAQITQTLPGGGLDADQTNTIISRSLE